MVARGNLRPSHHPLARDRSALTKLLLITHIGWESQVIGFQLSLVPHYLGVGYIIIYSALLNKGKYPPLETGNETLSSLRAAWFPMQYRSAI